MSLTKTNKVVGLFLAAALAVSGCSAEETYQGDDCLDENNDGYCDDDGSQTSGSSYIDVDGKKKYKRMYTGVTSGAKGGIGSSGYSSSG
ncbi:hypothetical protein [Brevibacillus sp. H7]|jgi:hypothetical protein|uniref:hypothetical protein n=1 Tax=Brevibacillus sp. H7 TaxID=3349138 RepID=UPI00381C1113